jgi:hypothetical protein
MYPALRKVQERFSPDGFSILGVMADKTVDTVRATVDTGDITWRCVWEGHSGPIGKIYNVQSYPRVILIDREGRIASTRLRFEEELIENVENVMKQRPE